MPPAGASAEPANLLELVLRHGSDATAFQTLRSGFRYFLYGRDACVAYVDTGGAWVAAGGPIAAPTARAEVVAAFLLAARAAGKRACFFAVEERLAAANEPLQVLAIGEQPVWDPRAWAKQLATHRSLREQLRRARAKGVRTRELSESEFESSVVRAQVARIAERWLARRAMAPMGFLVQVEPFTFTAQRRTFVAEQHGRVIGFAGVIPVPARRGWFLEDLIRDPEAPNGTGELLVHSVMSWASEAGCSWLTLGLSPLSGSLPGLLRRVRQSSGWLYDFAGLRAYKAKFRPDSWQPMYLCYPKAQPAWLSTVDALAAFAQGGFLHFGLRTLLRGPTIVLRALSWLLVPWTFLLALAPSERWFAASWTKWAWVGFDVVVALGLFRLLRKPGPVLLTFLACAISADAALTTVEVVTWSTRHAQSPLDYLVLGLACAGPTLAAIVLWGARSHRLRFG